ncbi:HTH-type transcriptional regulator DmlR [Pelagimonas phthalicica]|uniref:HTH-type transcriptional regulator DmlR n=1 Tax=Pelagimonas phthalicica TaxID=1037362 RepID=A0A238JAG2_9RHOB|nr:LysR family transcriptional regulator [Pelagimonas phthalicica]TDS93775.1 DNA-binding transcriptional LysR family regulator [Pelagimonas phthalicica]SMX27701.1 HTH-type transcriptional regulator DmlR [Pelagimonas phthalicica]
MRLPLPTLEIFNAIAREGSFKGAAQRLGLQPSTVSHQLKSLEDQLGTALIIRTTRSLSLTEAGRALLRGAGPAFDQLADAVETARSVGHAPRGTLRLAMTDFVHELYVGPALPSFCDTFPEIEIEMQFTDALTDLLAEELHAGFRLGDRIAPDMVAVRISRAEPLAVFASPSYLQKHGAPKTPSDLLDHDCIRYRFPTSRHIAPWTFKRHDEDYAVEVKGPLIANTLPAMVDLATRGLGLIFTFKDYCATQVRNEQLVPVLEDHIGKTPGTYIYFPREYRNIVPLRLFIDHLKAVNKTGS